MLGCLLSSQPPHGYSNPGAAEQESSTTQHLLPDTLSVSPACPRGFAFVRIFSTNTQADSYSPRGARDVRCGRETLRPSGLGRTRVPSRNQATLQPGRSSQTSFLTRHKGCAGAKPGDTAWWWQMGQRSASTTLPPATWPEPTSPSQEDWALLDSRRRQRWDHGSC